MALISKKFRVSADIWSLDEEEAICLMNSLMEHANEMEVPRLTENKYNVQANEYSKCSYCGNDNSQNPCGTCGRLCRSQQIEDLKEEVKKLKAAMKVKE